MKVRIRFSHGLSQGSLQSSISLNVVSSSEHATLADLKRTVYEYIIVETGCQKEEEGWRDVVVSLDGTHPLETLNPPQEGDSESAGDAMTSLQSLGLVRGDTIYVLDAPRCTRPAENQEDTQPPTRQDQGSEASTMHCRGMLPSVLFKIDTYVVEKGLNHRLTRNDAIALIIHGGLIDYGFDCCHEIEDVVGNVCKITGCVYAIQYVLRIEKISKHLEMVLYISVQRKNVMLVMQFPCGGSLVSKSIEIEPGEVCRDQGYRNSRKHCTIWSKLLHWTEEQCFHMLTVCKDTFCRHVLSLSCTTLGIEYPGACLSMMPADVKRKILSFLAFDDVCCLGMTCREFCTLHRENDLWMLLLEKYFERQTVVKSNVYGKYAAKQEFKRLMLAQREARSREQESSTIFGIRWTPPPPPPSWGQPRHRYPGIIGGDYDRLPPGLPQRRTQRQNQWRLE